VTTRVECYAYDIEVLEILQFVFNFSILQEVIWFNIVPPLVAPDLTKNLEEFNWESFEVWLNSISASLIACQDKESRGGASLGDEKIERSKSSSFPLPEREGGGCCIQGIELPSSSAPKISSQRKRSPL